MRKEFLSCVATALVGAGSALAQGYHSYSPIDEPAASTGPRSMPVLLSADPAAPPPAKAPAAPPSLGCGSTGLVPGVDCLPDCRAPRHDKFWIEASYLLAWIKEGPNAGPLAIALPAGGPFFGQGATPTTLIDGDPDFDGQSGGRLTVGTWFGCDNRVGFEASGFVLERTSLSTAVSNNGDPNGAVVIIRPFIDAATGTQNGVIVAGPDVPGNIIAQQSSRFWGAEGNLLVNWRDSCQRRTDLLLGFTYYDLLERLAISSFSTTRPQFPPVNLSFNDVIDTRNQFYGGQVGIRTKMNRGRLSLTGTSKIALGWTHESVDRFGSSSRTFFGGGAVASNTGFLVQTSNRGRLTDDRFAIALPSNLTLSYQVTDHLSTFVGYDFVYISRVARPGDQVDLTRQVDAAGLSVRPAGGIHVDDFWMNALQAGVRFQF